MAVLHELVVAPAQVIVIGPFVGGGVELGLEPLVGVMLGHEQFDGARRFPLPVGHGDDGGGVVDVARLHRTVDEHVGQQLVSVDGVGLEPDHLLAVELHDGARFGQDRVRCLFHGDRADHGEQVAVLERRQFKAAAVVEDVATNQPQPKLFNWCALIRDSSSNRHEPSPSKGQGGW